MTSSLTYPSLDLGFVRYWSPTRCLLAGLTFYAVATALSPLDYDLSKFTLPALIYAVAVFGAFFGGCYVFKATSPPIDTVNPLPLQSSLDRYVNIAMIIAIVGIFARIYDRFILRGFAVQETFAETRDTMEAQVSAFGYIGGLGFSFGLIALALVWLSKNQRPRPIANAVALLLSAYPMMEGLLAASRSPMLHTASLVFILARSTNSLNWLVRSRVALLIVGLALLAFFQLIFEIRTLQGGNYEESIAEVFRASGMAQYAPPPAWITNALTATDGQGFYATILKNWVHIEQHITHSWIVFFSNFANFDELEYGWGYNHFSLPLRVLSAITGERIYYDPWIHGMEEGMYGTALTNIYYDFGLFALPLSFAMGYLQTALQRHTILLPERWLPVYILICLSNFMALMDNPLTGGLGAFAIWASLGYIVIHFVVSLISQPTSTASEASVQPGASNA